jgi:glycosyltransferase involved in cell wall biosynthesis
MPRVSILMPTFNRGHTLQYSIASALAQTYKDFELVIYDDGSNEWDGHMTMKGKLEKVGPTTEQTLSRISDKRIRYHRESVNVGVAEARNRLIDMAEGEYLCWLDSDDRANKWRLEMQVKALDAIPEASYCRTAASTFSKEDDAMWKLPPIMVWRGGVSVATIMFKAESNTRFDTKFKNCCEDMDWECRYAADNGKGCHIPLTLYAIGRRISDRLTMRYKQDIYVNGIKADKARLTKKRTAAIEVMRSKGYEKKPIKPPWSLIEPYFEKWYGALP